MAEIKTVSDEQVKAVLDALSVREAGFFTRNGIYSNTQLATAVIEAAVLSASTGKVDAERRYEIVRKLNVPQFAELYRRNISGEGRFDDLVDQLGQQAIDAGSQ